jgi:hypothetical protein
MAALLVWNWRRVDLYLSNVSWFLSLADDR